jgi:cytochrome c-type biogenesis protein
VSTPTLGLSLLAGLLSFLSPCVLPLLPSYLSFVGGVSIKEMQEDASIRRRLFVNTLFFVLGFSLVFVALGVLFSGSVLFAPDAIRWINIVAGIIVIVLGLNIMFDFISVLNLERRFHFSRRPKGALGSFLVGLAFAAGWTPCIGPILTGILFLAGSSGTVGTGILYLSLYSAGLAIPFLLTALFFTRATGLFNRIKKHFRTIRILSGSLLILIGVLIALGRFQNLNIALYRGASAASRWSEQSPVAARVVPGLVLILCATLFSVRVIQKVRRRSSDTARFPWFAVTGGAVCLILATLQLAGFISVMNGLTAWLQFQGI